MPASAGEPLTTGRRSARLEPELASARDARRMLRDALAAVGVTEPAAWTDSAELAVHELVANAVLHAHTPIELTVLPAPHQVRVEVRDFEPTLPAPREYDALASTGRGMALVAAVTDECGARSLGPGGKVVWFIVGAQPSGGSAGQTWDVDTSRVVDADTADDRAAIGFLSMPVRLWLAARQHHDALLRELVLYLAERDPEIIDFALVDRARGTVSRVVAAVAETQQLRQDQSTRPSVWESESVDIVVEIPAELGPAFAALQDALDLGERLATNGELLIRPGLPEIIEVRDWVCHQIGSQLAGVAPAKWPGTARTRFETTANPQHGSATLPADVLGIRTSTRAVVAADVANRIVAVSPPLADLLGWEAGELVGRRLVTLIPSELREAHIAGFSRYLSTGEARLLGVPHPLPVLRRDGSQITCSLLVEEVPAAGGEAMFVAWVDPL